MSSEPTYMHLAAVAQISSGKRPPSVVKEKSASHQVPVIGGGGESGFTEQSLHADKILITGRVGTLGKLFVSNSACWPSDNALVIRPKSGFVNFQYLRYALGSVIQSAIGLNRGAANPLITQSDLGRLEIPVPEQDAQVRIAEILSRLDARIDCNRSINQTLEAMAQAIFKSWFVDFDPVKAKIAARAEGRDPLRAAMRAIGGKTDAELDALAPEQHAQLAATAALFPDELVDTPTGEIPAGWGYVAAESVSDVGIGKTPPRKEPQWFTERTGDWRWVSIKDMGGGTLYQQVSSEYLTKEAVSRFNVRVVPDNTVLLSFKLTVGRVAISDGELLTNEAIAHFKLPASPRVTSEFLYLYLKGFDFSSLGSTSSIAEAVNSKTIRELPILLPNGELVIRLTEAVQPLFREVRRRQAEVTTLADTRDALLPKLLSGELSVGATHPTHVEVCP